MVDEGANLNFNISATDPDLTTPSFTAENVPTNATFVDNTDGSGTFDFNPDFSQSGTYDVTFIASDGALTDTEIVTITVNHVNLAPVLDPIGAQSVAEGVNLNFGTSASDFDGGILTLTAENLPANATYTDNLDNTGTFDFNPDFFQGGSYDVTFIASDGALADTEIVTITVGNSNLKPVADAGPDQFDVPVSSIVTLDGTGSSDPDIQPLTYDWLQISGPGVSLSDPTDPMPTFAPPLPGTYQFELVVSDGDLFSDPDTVDIIVINVAPPEAITDLTIAINADAIDLAWSEITFDTDALPTTISGYIIYRNTKAYYTPANVDSIGVTDAATFSFTDNNLGGANVVGDTLTQYFYVVVAFDIYGNRAANSNIVGEYDYQLVTATNSSYNLICVPFENTGINTAVDLINAIGVSNVNTVNNYQNASQSFESRFAAGFGVNFAVNPGGIYQINAKAASIFSVAGNVPAPGSVNYELITTSTTNYSFIAIPFDMESLFSVAQDVINYLPGSFNTLNRFIANSQSYESRFAAGFGVNFTVKAGKPYQANAAVNDIFPGL
ncbi:MAG: Ig-like domain-containing protein [bacterium]